MKKIISVVLAAIMIFTFVPYLALAANGNTETASDYENLNYDVELTEKGLKDLEYRLTSGKNYRLAENITVPAGTTLFVGEGAVLYVPEGKTLTLGTTAVNYGTIGVAGSVTNADVVTNHGTFEAKITFPNLKDCGLVRGNGEPIIAVSFASSENGNAYEDISSNLVYTHVPVEGGSYFVPLLQYFYVVAHIIEPGEPNNEYDKFDDALMNVRLNSVPIDYTQGNHHTFLITSGKISYSSWTSDDAFLNTFKIDLPNKEGANIYGREGEKSVNGEIIEVKYGQSFSFRVDIDEAYSKSAIEVYIVEKYGWDSMDMNKVLEGLKPVEPDNHGYYNIVEVKSDYTVFVLGLVSNDTIDTVSNIFETVKNVFELIKKFFLSFLELFGFKFD